MNLELSGKRALVSGSTAGIGYAIAEALAREGARVVVNGRTEAAVSAARSGIGRATGSQVDGFAGDLEHRGGRRRAGGIAFPTSTSSSTTSASSSRSRSRRFRTMTGGGSSRSTC